MAFSATTFIFDGIPSEFFNLYLGELAGEGESVVPMSNDVLLHKEQIFRRPKPFFYGAEQTPVLEFTISAFFPEYVDAHYFAIVSSWLFGQQEYKELLFCQSDMTDIHFNCFLTMPNVMRVGNLIRGFTATVVCDSPFGWLEDRTYQETISSTPATVNIFNYSDETYYTKPTEVVVTFNSSGGDGTIVNTSDENRTTSFVGITASDVITMNSDLETISDSLSETDLLAGTKFNYNWLRLIKGHNILTVTGNISSLDITSPVAIKIG